MIKNKLTILIGLPGVGKSTYAKELLKSRLFDATPSVIVNKDSLRTMLYSTNSAPVNETVIRSAQIALLNTLRHTNNVILDNTNCKIKNLTDLIEENCKNYEIELVFVKEQISHKELLDLNNNRESYKRVPTVSLDSMFQSYSHLIKYKNDLLTLVQNRNNSAEPNNTIVGTNSTYNNYGRNPKLPRAVIVDIDGTVAHMHNRGPFEWDKVDSDLVDENVTELLRAISDHYKLIFVSGRDEACKDMTRTWLQKYGFNVEHLYMRPKGSFEKDSVIKKRIYDQHIKDNYDVRFVLDDRNQVVEFWRSIGLKCLQVEEGNF